MPESDVWFLVGAAHMAHHQQAHTASAESPVGLELAVMHITLYEDTPLSPVIGMEVLTYFLTQSKSVPKMSMSLSEQQHGMGGKQKTSPRQVWCAAETK